MSLPSYHAYKSREDFFGGDFLAPQTIDKDNDKGVELFLIYHYTIHTM